MVAAVFNAVINYRNLACARLLVRAGRNSPPATWLPIEASACCSSRRSGAGKVFRIVKGASAIGGDRHQPDLRYLPQGRYRIMMVHLNRLSEKAARFAAAGAPDTRSLPNRSTITIVLHAISTSYRAYELDQQVRFVPQFVPQTGPPRPLPYYIDTACSRLGAARVNQRGGRDCWSRA